MMGHPDPGLARRRFTQAGLILGVLVLLALLYGPNVTAPLVSDDLHFMSRVPGLSPATLFRPDGQWLVYRVFYRPLTCMFYLLPATPLWWHLPQFALMLLACYCVHGIARHVLRTTWGPGMATLLFALHPSHVQPTVWAADLADTLLLCLGLSAVWQFLGWQRQPGGWRLLGIALTTTAALASKETAVSLLPIFMVLQFPWPPMLAWLWLPFLNYGYIRYCYARLQDPADPFVREYQDPARYHVAGLVDRFWQHVVAVVGAPDIAAGPWMAAVVGLIAWAAWSGDRRTRGWAARLVAWMGVGILPTIGLFDVRYAAWPGVPFVLLLVLALETMRPRPAMAIGAALCILWFARTWPEARLWRTAALQFDTLQERALTDNRQYLALPYAVDGTFLGCWHFHAYEFSDPIYIYWINGTTAAWYYEAPPDEPVSYDGQQVTVAHGTVRPAWPSILGPVSDAPISAAPWQYTNGLYWRH